VDVRERGVRELRAVKHVMRRRLQPATFVLPTEPLSDYWGIDRGTPIDRLYIETFLERHRDDIRGRVLEIKNSGYARRYGRDVESVDVLDIDADNLRATIVADLCDARVVDGERFDCFILTQTLMYVHDLRAAVAESHRMLRPGGVLLASVSALNRTDPDSPTGDYWRVTSAGCSLVFAEAFGAANVRVQAHGNLAACVGFLVGMSREDVTGGELQGDDPRFPLVIVIRAVKA
jgi:SAM-dependent methyltransferase